MGSHIDMTAHIFPQKTRASPDQANNNVYSMNWWFRLYYRTDWRKTLNREDGIPNSRSQSRTAPPLATRAKTESIFVKRIGLGCAIRYRPAEPPSSSRDENSILVKKSKSGMSDKSDPAGTLLQPPDEKYIFVKKDSPSEPTLPLQTAGQQADYRGRAFNFRQEIFQRATVFQIRCSSQRVSPILIYRTEQFR